MRSVPPAGADSAAHPGADTTSTVTLRDVARTAGVSISTASRAMSGHPSIAAETKRRVQRAASDLRYLPNAQARSLRSARTGTIGLIVSDVANPYFAQLASQIEGHARTAGLSTLLCNANEDSATQERYLELLRSQRVDGIIIAPQCATSPGIDHFRVLGTPVVLIDRHIDDPTLPAVTSDPVPGLHAAITRLAANGHTRIGYLAGPVTTSTGIEREAAFRSGLVCAGLTVDPELIHRGTFHAESGATGAIELLDRGATALIASDANMTTGVLHTIAARGLRRGHDFDIIGFDDLPLFKLLTPQLSIIDQDLDRMCAEAFTQLTALLGGGSAHSVRIPTRLIVRGDDLAGSPRGITHPGGDQ